MTSAFSVFPPHIIVPPTQPMANSVLVTLNMPRSETQIISPISSAPSTDYVKRASENDFAPPEDVRRALLPSATAKTKKSVTYVLDVRSSEEISQDALDLSILSPSVKWATTPCSLTACPALEADPTSFVPEKDATVVVHCASGKRAYRAKQVLAAKGYTHVLNGGSLDDMRNTLNVNAKK